MEKISFKRGKRARSVFLIFNTLFMMFLCAAVLIPIIKIFSASIANTNTYGIDLLPKAIDLTAYKSFKFEYGIHSFYISCLTTAATAFLGVMATSISAYILMQRDMPGVRLFKAMLIITLVFNAGIMPEYIVMKKLHLTNSLWAVMLPMCLNVANIFLLRAYFEQLPQSILDAAEIDGCTPVQKFFAIVMPLSRAPLAVTGFLFATAAWNEYIRYVIYISDTTKYNLQWAIRDAVAPGCIGEVCPEWFSYTDYIAWVCVRIIVGLLPAAILVPIFLHFLRQRKIDRII